MRFLLQRRSLAHHRRTGPRVNLFQSEDYRNKKDQQQRQCARRCFEHSPDDYAPGAAGQVLQ